MKVELSISIVIRHGQYYARWRSDEKRQNERGKWVSKEYFEPTGVPAPAMDASPEEIEKAENFAKDVAAYMAEHTGFNVPTPELQQTKLKEFAIKSARDSKDCISEFIPEWLIEYACTKDEDGELVQMSAAWTMANTWDQVLQNLGPDSKKHPSVISPANLQAIVDALPGKQERHAINVRAALAYGVTKGKVMKSHNPAEDLIVRSFKAAKKIAFPTKAIRRGLEYMQDLKDGDQWQNVTLCGIYTPMRFLTACRLRLKPDDFHQLDRPGAVSYLDTSTVEWHIEYFDTKSKKWEVQLLDSVFVQWLRPYIAKHKLGPGDYLFPMLARLGSAPSSRWERIIEASGYKMVYSKAGKCLTGYHTLRISMDKWLKENDVVVLVQDDIPNALRHTEQVHKKHYDSQAINAGQQRRINEGRPKFLPIEHNDTVELDDVRAEKLKLQTSLQALEARENDLVKLIERKSKDA